MLENGGVKAAGVMARPQAQEKAATGNAERILVAATIVLLVTAVYARTWVGFVAGWHDEQNQQGWLVLPLTAFIVYVNWPRLRSIPVRGNIVGGSIVLGLALLVQVAGVWLGLNRSVGYSFVFAVTGLSLYFLGTAMTVALAFPLAFLLFMVPTPGGVIDQISSPLQRFSAAAVQTITGLAGVTVHAEGVTLFIPNKGIQLEVAEGCSGLHSLTAMTMVAAIFAYFSHVPLRWKWGLFALALPVALIGNIVRIFFVVMIANSHGEAAGMAFHDSTLGKFAPFLVAIAIVMGAGRAIEWTLARREEQDGEEQDREEQDGEETQ